MAARSSASISSRLSARRRIDGSKTTGTALARLLGRVHRGIRVGQQVGRDRVAPAGEGQADAHADHERPAVEDDRPAQLVGDPFGHRDRLGLVADAFDEDRELVATLARGDVAGPHDPRQAMGDLDRAAGHRRRGRASR